MRLPQDVNLAGGWCSLTPTLICLCRLSSIDSIMSEGEADLVIVVLKEFQQ